MLPQSQRGKRFETITDTEGATWRFHLQLPACGSTLVSLGVEMMARNHFCEQMYTCYVLSTPVGAMRRRGHSIPILMVQFNTEQTGWWKTTPRPFSSQNWWHSFTLSRPDIVKQFPGPSLPKLMAQFNTDVDSGIIRISQLIDCICPYHSC